MTTAVQTGPSKNVSVTVLGFLTMLWGIVHTTLGVYLLFVGKALTSSLQKGDLQGVIAVVGFLAAIYVIGIGVASVAAGILGMLAGLGVLWRKQWGRILTVIVAVLALIWSLAFLDAYIQDADGKVFMIAFGAAELLYGIVAVVLAIKNGSAFSRSRI